jgi:predicted glycoside hydrolase/deacetylase ChbG (UPF0249 family)
MLIVNADDWGRTTEETDAALLCHRAGRITSVTAMMFMADSQRAAALALGHGIDVGLHLNLSQPFTGCGHDAAVDAAQRRTCAVLGSGRLALLVYHPLLRHDLVSTYRAQVDEFLRLYGRAPSHVDGHHHRHLCANVLWGRVIPEGEKVRRNFHFWPGEKTWLNRAYRRIADRQLARRYRITDYFFALSQCLQGDRLARVVALARSHSVEVMTHPAREAELDCLMGDRYLAALQSVERGTYASI